MRILALDTATAATVVALLDTHSGLSVEARDDPPPRARPAHASRLLGLIESLLAGSGGWARVDRIAVGVGPGTFTGLRIGVATAQGLALARGCPIVAVSTLDSLAAAAHGVAVAQGREALAVIDARRGEVFLGGPGVPAAVRGPGQLAPEADGRLAVGDGAVQFREALVAAGAMVPDPDSPLHRVNGLEHCRLAERAQPQPPQSIQPLYLRVPDAELTA
ncbi:MAG TPA: tRNA (adenosine(37)-N6)-threonylcarbamoyltransferase complex dimerization subunit type 1 TsaB [Solirubrobacteraceae bacterium]|nr:tRNA (adenosine(37)-N6)-threonylcarbamoyltransferase complex dimerization subunit type 1 TsaB [Solirubrobacteraceae bacterium]